MRPYALAFIAALSGCAASGHLPSVNKNNTDYQIFRAVRIACVYDGTVKVHKSGEWYSFEGDDNCSSTVASWERVCRESDPNGDYKSTPQELADLENKVFAQYAR